mmetsp:Transcript_42578/g.133646  ORF Transcript_42578/g.133646 Transcript_42578/m.133646 type:complete len:214 (+) Transcript_42578:173-814(+)
MRSLLPPEGRGVLGARSERLDAVGRDEQRVLELCRPLAVLGGRRPAVAPQDVLLDALANHGLDREGVPHLHRPWLVVARVDHVRRLVEDASHAVAAKLSHGAVAVRGDVVLDDSTDALVLLSRSAVRDGGLPGVVRHLDQLPARLVHLANQECLGAVPVVASVVACDVDVDDVTWRCRGVPAAAGRLKRSGKEWRRGVGRAVPSRSFDESGMP